MTRPPCAVPGCGRRHYGHGYCRPHHARWSRHGDPQADLPIEAKTTGGVGYWACHERVKATRGPATAHLCAECGAAAVDWSYDGADPAERVSAQGYRYSLDPARYRPRCRSCHRRVTVAHRGPRPASPSVVDVDRAMRLYRAGASGRGIAQLLGTSRSAVYTALHAAGVAMRPRGRRGRPTPVDPAARHPDPAAVASRDVDEIDRTSQP
jgi:hypothetical protein